MLNVKKINFSKLNGLVPVCIQDQDSMQVLMMGFMNLEALNCTLNTGRFTLWSRSKNRLWEKGETSGNYLTVIDINADCDNDSLLIYVKPQGPTCHTGETSCFHSAPPLAFSWLAYLVKIIATRHQNPIKESYPAKLFANGVKRIAQKVGEEGVEVALAAATGDKTELVNETADLLFHILVLLKAQDLEFADVLEVVKKRILEKSFASREGA